MAIATLQQIMDPAFKERYGVPAFNAVDAITLDGLMQGAERSNSPMIIQISVKTVKYWGAAVVHAMFTSMAKRVSVPVTLHLDHCPEVDVAKECLEVGWNSVLFDGSGMSFEDNFRITKEITEFASRRGAHVEGEVVAVGGVEDGVGSDTEGQLISIAEAIKFVQETGIYCYAPAIGTAHGFYQAAPTIRYERMNQIVEATGVPMVLHGGSGLDDEVFRRLIAGGAAKVNISTALKKVFADGLRSYLDKQPTEYNPLKLTGAVRDDVIAMAQHYFKLFGSEGKA